MKLEAILPDNVFELKFKDTPHVRFFRNKVVALNQNESLS